MKYFTFFVLILLSACTSPKSDSEIEQVKNRLYQISEMDDAKMREQNADDFFDSLVSNKMVPLTENESVLFLYRGEADTVTWNGDFNSWGNDEEFNNLGTRIDGTDIWMAEESLPSDGRYDYKVTINKQDWKLDPGNPYVQFSGFGPNSELRMPDWKPEPLKTRTPEADKGTFSTNNLISSENLGYDLTYRVYLPPNYSEESTYPVAYFSDGQEYSDDRLGATIIMLDNLIHLDKIEPIVGVFVSPLDPNDESINRRGEEFGNNPEYLNFFVDELIPEIENTYSISDKAENRAIIGTSLGGLLATYFSFSHPEIFGNAGIQAPAYWYRDEIFDMVKNSTDHPQNIFMSVGTVADNTEDARLMKQILENKSIDFTYLEVNEGHSWGAWSAQTDNMLIQFFR